MVGAPRRGGRAACRSPDGRVVSRGRWPAVLGRVRGSASLGGLRPAQCSPSHRRSAPSVARDTAPASWFSPSIVAAFGHALIVVVSPLGRARSHPDRRDDQDPRCHRGSAPVDRRARSRSRRDHRRVLASWGNTADRPDTCGARSTAGAGTWTRSGRSCGRSCERAAPSVSTRLAETVTATVLAAVRSSAWSRNAFATILSDEIRFGGQQPSADALGNLQRAPRSRTRARAPTRRPLRRLRRPGRAGVRPSPSPTHLARCDRARRRACDRRRR